MRKEALIGLLKAPGPSQSGVSPHTMPTPGSVLIRGPNSVPPAVEEKCSSMCGERSLLAIFSTTQKQEGTIATLS